VQKGEFEKAAQQLHQAVELSPENILAHQLYAECLVRLKKPVDALNAYKMVLFLNPNDTKAAKLVSRLETELFAPPKPSEEDSLTEDFSMQKLTDVANIANEVSLGQREKTEGADRTLERELAHLDVSLDRGDWPKAREILDGLLKTHPDHEEVLQRHMHLQDLTNTSIDLEFIEPLATPPAQNKIKKLQRALENIEYHRRA
jgi:tetratricopeptide (TPR) repeat protein